MTNKQLAERFVEGDTGSKGNNMFIIGDTIYSYGKHFPIARRIAINSYLVNSTKYSSSTNRHQRHVLNAILKLKLNQDIFITHKTTIELTTY